MKRTFTTFSLACLLAQGAFGQNTSSLSFDGVDGFVEFGTDPMFEFTGSFSLEAWIKAAPAQNAPWGRIIDKFHYTNIEGYNLVINTPDNTTRFEIATTNGFIHISGTSVITDDQWHHVVGTFDGSTMKLYVDGVLERSQAFGAVTLIPSETILTVGSNDDGNGWLPFEGKIDQVRIWNTCIGLSDIQYNMNNCLNGDENGLLGCWDFGPGTMMVDKTANGNAGVFTAGVVESSDVPYACAVSGLEEEIASLELKAVPNPFSEQTVIEIPESMINDEFTLTIFNVAGELLTSSVEQGKKHLVIQKKQLAPGTYFLHIVTGQQAQTLSLIIE